MSPDSVVLKNEIFIARASRMMVIANADAGSGAAQESLASVAGHFRAAGIEAEIVLARSAAGIAAAVQRAPGEAPRAVVAAGGDGTINAVASALVDTGIPLGVLPLGTLNHFARDLHIPADLAQAVQVIVAGHVRAIDVGDVNGRLFLNNSSLGIYPEIVRGREQQRLRLGTGKWLAFLRATLAVLRRNPYLNVRMTVDGQDLRRRTPFVFVGNNEYCMEGFHIGERRCLDAGRLNVYVARHAGRLNLLRLAFLALLGRLRETKDLEVFSAAEIVVETHRSRIHVATDGEVGDLAPPLRFRIRPGALRVIAPAPA